MRHALALALLIVPLAASAQEDGGLGALIEDSARGVIEDMIEDMRPAIDEMEALMAEYGPILRLLGEEMGPALLRVFREVDSIAHYAPPEILPNGDIIMRRNPDAPAWVPPPEPEDRPTEPGDRPDSGTGPQVPSGIVDL